MIPIAGVMEERARVGLQLAALPFIWYFTVKRESFEPCSSDCWLVLQESGNGGVTA